MNQQLQRLKEQAGIQDNPDQEGLDLFASLIVQECIDILSPFTVRMGNPGEEYLHPIQEIKRHFGVKL